MFSTKDADVQHKKKDNKYMYTQLTQHLLEATALEADNKSDHRRKAQAFLVSKGIPEGLAEALSYSMEWAGDVKAACESSLREDMNTRINLSLIHI